MSTPKSPAPSHGHTAAFAVAAAPPPARTPAKRAKLTDLERMVVQAAHAVVVSMLHHTSGSRYVSALSDILGALASANPELAAKYARELADEVNAGPKEPT